MMLRGKPAALHKANLAGKKKKCMHLVFMARATGQNANSILRELNQSRGFMCGAFLCFLQVRFKTKNIFIDSSVFSRDQEMAYRQQRDASLHGYQRNREFASSISMLESSLNKQQVGHTY